MRKRESGMELPVPPERVRLQKPIGRKLFGLVAFFVCAAILVAAFAVSGIWSSFSAPVETFFEGIFHRDRVTEQKGDTTGQPSTVPETEPDRSPEREQNAIPIVARTLIEPNRAGSISEEEPFRFAAPPAVLIYCSNPKESYLPEGDFLPEGKVGEATFSADSSQTVCAVAKTLLNALSKNGIFAIYAEPENGDGYLGSSARAAKLVQKTLSEHPQISLVIEIGRDSIFDAEGNYIKTVADNSENPTAQILAVVGSGGSRIPNPAYQTNLNLAKALQSAVEKETPGLFRGIRVQSTPQNQQYAPFSLSLLVGSGANSPEEAERSIKKIAAVFLSMLSDF